MNGPGKRTDHIEQLFVLDVLHPLDMDTVIAESSTCDFDHLWRGVDSVCR